MASRVPSKEVSRITEVLRTAKGEPEETANDILEVLAQAAGADRGALLIRRGRELYELACFPSDCPYFAELSSVQIDEWVEPPTHQQPASGHVAATKEEVVIDDARAPEWALKRYPASPDTNSEYICPIIDADRGVLGVVCLDSDKRRHFRDSRRSLIRAMVPGAALVMRQIKTARLQRAKIEFINQVVRLSQSGIIQKHLTADLTPIYAECFEHLRQLIPFEAASIWIDCTDRRILVLRAYAADDRWNALGLQDGFLPNDPQNVMLAQALARGETIYEPCMADLHLHVRVARELYADCQFLAVPMRMGTTGTQGVLTVFVPSAIMDAEPLLGDIELVTGEVANFVERVQIQRVISASNRTKDLITQLAVELDHLHDITLPSTQINDGLSDYCRDMGYGEIGIYFAHGGESARLVARSEVYDDVVVFKETVDLRASGAVQQVLEAGETMRIFQLQDEGGCHEKWLHELQGRAWAAKPAMLYWKIAMVVPVLSPSVTNRGAAVVVGKQPHVRGLATFFDRHDEAELAIVGASCAHLHNVVRAREREIESTTMAGHEVRNVLQTLSFALETVYSKVTVDSRERVERTRLDILKQIDLMVFLARGDDIISNPHWELNEELIGLHGDVIAPIASLTFAMAKDRLMRVVYDNLIERRVPRLFIDKFRMQQVIFNLISNAVKYGDLGSRIELIYHGKERIAYGKKDTPFHVFSLRNMGCGIDPGERDRIFGLFQRGRKAREIHFEGQGKGLSLARAIMRRHGGDIWVAECGGSGEVTEIRFAIPASREQQR